MGYLDVPLILLSLAFVSVGQTFWSSQSKKRRALVAISQRNQYFNRLEQDSREMIDERNTKIEDLENENQKMKAELEKLGFASINYGDKESLNDLERIRTSLEQKKLHMNSLDRELDEIRSRNCVNDTQIDELSDKIDQLQSENKVLESRLEKLDKISMPVKDTADPEVQEYLQREGSKYSLESLDALYEKVLDEKVADPNGLLDSYEARIKKMDYSSEKQRLDVERRRIEKIYEREKRLHEEDIKAFRESYIEYCFKITAAREEYNSRKELNDTDEQLVNACRRMDSRRVFFDKSWQDNQENHYT